MSDEGLAPGKTLVGNPPAAGAFHNVVPPNSPG